MQRRQRGAPAYASRPRRRVFLVAYDVETTTAAGRRRLRAAARACEAVGQRVQWSVFECLLSSRELEVLRKTLLDMLQLGTDRLIIALLGAPDSANFESYGPPPARAPACVVEA